MPRGDYNRRAYSRSRRRQSSPVAWLVVGMLTGAALVGLVWLKLGPAPATGPVVVHPMAPAAQAPMAEPPSAEKTAAYGTLAESPESAADSQPDASSETRPPPEAEVQPPRFEYYSVLPEMEVVIPPEELHKDPSAKPLPPAMTSASTEVAMTQQPGQSMDQVTPQATTEGGVYLMQHGSFRRTEDADRLKASLALMGISARIEKVTIDDKGIYYRVRSGAYNKEQAYGLHARLKDNGVDSQVIRIKK